VRRLAIAVGGTSQTGTAAGNFLYKETSEVVETVVAHLDRLERQRARRRLPPRIASSVNQAETLNGG